MGNRAVITTTGGVNKFGLYVHWNGGKDTILGILNYLVTLDKEYKTELEFLHKIEEIYKFCFGNKYEITYWEKLDTDNYDNGVYILDKDKVDIIGRMYAPEVEQNEYDIVEMTEYIEEKIKERDFFKSKYILNVYNVLKENMFKYKVDFEKEKLIVEDKVKQYSDDNPNKPRYVKVQKELKEQYGGDYIEFTTNTEGLEW